MLAPKKTRRLFLGLLLLGLLLGTLLPDTDVTGIGSGLAEGLVRTTLDVLGEVVLGDLGEAGGDRSLDTESGGNGLDGLGGVLVLGGVGLLGLVGLAGEEDEAVLVGLQALDIGGEALLGEVLAAGINGDTDGGGKELGDAGSLMIIC